MTEIQKLTLIFFSFLEKNEINNKHMQRNSPTDHENSLQHRKAQSVQQQQIKTA